MSESLSIGEPSAETTRQDLPQDEQIRTELEAQGWQLAGQEFPFINPLDTTTGRFDKKRVLSDEDIHAKYVEQYGRYGFNEVHIEPARAPDTGHPNASRVYVFMRRPADIPSS